MPDPTLECDIVMKGGITSGVVYPLAIVRLSKSFRFRNIGGTSAGAMAAAATAAGEYGRDDHNLEVGFGKLKEMPKWLRKPSNGDKTKSNLMALFQAQPRTEGLFGLVTAALEPKNKLWHVARSSLKTHWLAVLIGVIPGVTAMVLMRPVNTLEIVLDVLVGLLVLGVGALIAVLMRVFQSVSTDLPANGFGLCNGYRPDPRHEPTDAPLTEWLDGYLQHLAGRGAQDKILTFADLQTKHLDILG